MLYPIAARIVTDSNAMLPAELIERFGILAVPLTIVIDGDPHREDEIDLVTFYEQLRCGTVISTSAPSPGEILATYERAVSAGAGAILSVHVGSNRSATVASARLAAEQLGVPVTIVDTGTASFIEGCCVWRAAEQLAAGASIDAAASAARALAAEAASVFTIGEIARAARSGRLALGADDGLPVFASSGADMHELRRVESTDAAIEVMVELVAGHGGPLRVGVGNADADPSSAACSLEDALLALPNVAETIRYTVGPSVAAHTGAGTFGAVFHQI